MCVVYVGLLHAASDLVSEWRRWGTGGLCSSADIVSSGVVGRQHTGGNRAVRVGYLAAGAGESRDWHDAKHRYSVVWGLTFAPYVLFVCWLVLRLSLCLTIRLSFCLAARRLQALLSQSLVWLYGTRLSVSYVSMCLAIFVCRDLRLLPVLLSGGCSSVRFRVFHS